MNCDWQTLATIAIVMLAAGSLLGRLVRLLRGKGSRCGSCRTCPTQTTEPPQAGDGFVPLGALKRPASREQ